MKTLDHDFKALVVDDVGVCLAAQSEDPKKMDVVLRIQSGAHDFAFSFSIEDFCRFSQGLRNHEEYLRTFVGRVQQ